MIIYKIIIYDGLNMIATSITANWLPLCGTALVLGARHGLDPDHLAIIDGFARYNFPRSARIARWCGTLFSAGHGSVVLLVAVALGTAASAWAVPGWFQVFGTWTSVLFLIALGLLNLRGTLAVPREETVRVGGLRSRLLAGLTRTSHPAAILATGALFAVSFDTLSQVAFFAASGAQLGGLHGSLALGALFVLGMMLVDGLNSAWLAGLLRRADGRARFLSRVVGWFVALLSLAIAVLEILRWFNAGVELDALQFIVSALLIGLAACGLASLAWTSRGVRAGSRPGGARS